MIECEKCKSGFRGFDRLIGVQSYEIINKTISFWNCAECKTTYTKREEKKCKNWKLIKE